MKKRLVFIHIQILLIVLIIHSCAYSDYQVKETTSSVIQLEETHTSLSIIDNYIEPYKDSLDAKMNKVIGQSAQKLTNGIPESLLSNFTSDLVLSESKTYCKTNELPLPDVAIINHRGLRAIIDQGPITINNIYRLMPFENEIVLLSLNKTQLIELFNYMSTIGGDGMAGASFEILDKQAKNIKVNNVPLNKEKYIVATSDYIANGGDNYNIFKEAESRTGTGIKLRDVIIEHIDGLNEKNILIDSKLDNRISYASK